MLFLTALGAIMFTTLLFSAAGSQTDVEKFEEDMDQLQWLKLYRQEKRL